MYQATIRSFLRDPALLAMGLVPAKPDAGSPAEPGVALSWRAAWSALGIGSLALIGLFWNTASGMVHTWYVSDTFNHGFLIVPICAYLVWIKRGALAECVPRPTLLGLLPMLAAAFGWLLGHIASVASVQQFALVLMVQSLFVTVLGRRIAWILVFPLFYLFFAVPFGEFLIPPLQDLTAVFVVAFLRLIGIPVFLDGIFISIPTGNFVVAEACSGVRFLIATLALGFLFAELTYRSLWRRAAFVALAFVVPIVANGFRALGIVLIAYWTDHQLAVGIDHIVYGWVFFAFVTVILLAIGMTFRDGLPDALVPDPEVMRAAAHRRVVPRRIAAVAAAGLAAAALAPAYASYIDGGGPGALRAPLGAPAVSDGWTAEAGAPSPAWTPVFPGADARLLQSYGKDGQSVQLFIAYYLRKGQDVEVISALNSVTGDDWTRAAGQPVEVSLEGSRQVVDATRMLLRRQGRLALHWYWVGGTYTANPYYAKILQARDRLLRGGGPSAAIVVSVAYDDTPAEAEALLRDFVSAMEPLRPRLQQLVLD